MDHPILVNWCSHLSQMVVKTDKAPPGTKYSLYGQQRNKKDVVYTLEASSCSTPAKNEKTVISECNDGKDPLWSICNADFQNLAEKQELGATEVPSEKVDLALANPP